MGNLIVCAKTGEEFDFHRFLGIFLCSELGQTPETFAPQPPGVLKA